MRKEFILGIAVLSCAAILRSQDFGFDYYSVEEYRSLGAGYSLQNFTPRPSNSLPDSIRIRFTTHLPCIEYRETGLHLGAGYQEYSLNGKSRSAFSVYAESYNDFSLAGKAVRSGFFLPVVVSANYVNAGISLPGLKNFDVASLGIGSGLKYRTMTRAIGFSASAVGIFHYASEGFSIEYGSSVSYIGEVQLILPEVLFSGITAGFRYQFQSWNMSDAQLDYQRYYYGPFFGVCF